MPAYTPGTVLLQRPLAQLWWCITHRTQPHAVSVAQAALSVVVLLLQRGCAASHTVLCIGGGEFVHSTLGAVVLWRAAAFPPGFLETCVVLEPRIPRAWDTAAAKRLVGARISLLGFLATPLVACFPALFSSSPSSALHNCTELTHRLWLECAGVDLAKPLGLHPKGILPCRFFEMREFW